MYFTLFDVNSFFAAIVLTSRTNVAHDITRFEKNQTIFSYPRMESAADLRNAGVRIICTLFVCDITQLGICNARK